MATIVIHKKSGKRYALLGAGFGAFRSAKPNWLLGDMMADTNEGQFTLVCVARKDGQIRWVESSDLTVETIDGVPVKEAITENETS